MTARMLAALSCKVLAIFVLIKVISDLNWASVFISALQPDVGGYEIIIAISAIVISFLFLTAIGYILWFRTDYLTQKMMVKDFAIEESRLKSDDIQAIAFSAVGVIVLADAIPDIVQQIFYIWQMRSAQYMITEQWNNFYTVSRIAGLSLQIVIGLWLFFGSRGIVGLVRTLRRAGVKKPEA
ncbi:MAG: hypothetical protein ACOY46_12710 [Bacillota bacterium]